MSRKTQRQKKSKPRRPLFGEHSWFEQLWGKIREKVGNMAGVKALTEGGEEPAEPIDFSAPSIPYYVNLAEKFHLARIVLYMVLFAFLVVTLLSSRQVITYENLYYLVKDINAAGITAHSEADYLNYPVSQATPDFALFRGGLVIAGGQEITALSGSGKQTLSDNVSLTTPCVSAGGQYFVVYSRGEKHFMVYNAFVRVHKELTEFPVYDACMAEDGSFAVLTRSMDYNSEVVWYNDKMNKLAACHIGGYVTAMAVSADSRSLAVLSVETKDGAYESKVTLLRRTAGGQVTHRELLKTGAGLGVSFLTDDAFCVVYDEGFCVYRTDGSLQNEVAFGEEAPLLWGSTTAYFAILCENQTKLSEKTLKVFDKNGKIVYNADIDPSFVPTHLVMDGQTVYLHHGERILRVSGGGESLAEATVDRNTLGLLVGSEGDLLALSPAFACYVDPHDFEELS